MASPRYRCPVCSTVLVKSDIDQMLGDSGGFISFGSPVITCPACRHSIDRQKVVAGTYDVKSSNTGCLVAVAIVIALIVLAIVIG